MCRRAAKKTRRPCYEALMTFARLSDVLVLAAGSGHGLGAFNVFSIEHAEAFTAAAEVARTPVVLQISQNAVRYHGAVAPIGRPRQLSRRATRVGWMSRRSLV